LKALDNQDNLDLVARFEDIKNQDENVDEPPDYENEVEKFLFQASGFQAV